MWVQRVCVWANEIMVVMVIFNLMKERVGVLGGGSVGGTVKYKCVYVSGLGERKGGYDDVG